MPETSTPRNHKALWTWWQKKAASLNPELLVVAGTALLLWVGVSGYVTGRMPLTTPEQNNTSATNVVEHNKLVIPFLWGIGTLLALPYLVAIDARIKESEKNRTIVQLQVQRNDLEYLSLMTRYFGNSLPDKLDGLSEEIDSLRRMKGEAGFKEFLNQQYEELLARQEAIGGLYEGLEQDEKDPAGLVNTIRSTCDTATAGCHLEREERELFHKCMYAYIRAWLVCSIQYGTRLPIDSIFYQDPFREELYRNAIKDLSNRFGYEPIDKFLKTPRSRKIVQEHLGQLVELIEQKNQELDESIKNSLETIETST